MRDLDTNALRIFRAVASAGGISRAAEELHYVQSNVSARILQLEDQLGTPLFIRKSRGMELTLAGRVLKDYADKVLRLLGEAKSAVEKTNEPGASLAIGSTETTAAYRLPAILVCHRQRFPEVRLSLETATTDQLIEKVLDHKLNGAFIAGEIDHKDLVDVAVFEEELVLATRDEISDLDDLVGLDLLLPPKGSTYRERAEEWLRSERHTPAQILEYGSLEVILGCVAAGLGATIMPRVLVDQSQYREAVCVKALPDGRSRVTTHFIRQRDSSATKAMTGLIEIATMAYDKQAMHTATPAPHLPAGSLAHGQLVAA